MQRAGRQRRPAAVKTGTANDARDLATYGYLAPPEGPERAGIAVGRLDGQQRPLDAARRGAGDLADRRRAAVALVRPRLHEGRPDRRRSSARRASSGRRSTRGRAASPARGPATTTTELFIAGTQPGGKQRRSTPPACCTRASAAAGWSTRVKAELGPRSWDDDVATGWPAPGVARASPARSTRRTAYFWDRTGWGGPLAGPCWRPASAASTRRRTRARTSPRATSRRTLASHPSRSRAPDARRYRRYRRIEQHPRYAVGGDAIRYPRLTDDEVRGHPLTCASCGAENKAGRKFCAECGASLVSTCPTCGVPYEPGERFCGECGTSLVAGAAPAPATARASALMPPGGPPSAASRTRRQVPVAERRPRLGPVRGPRRLHAVRRGARRGGRPRDPDPLLRPRHARSSTRYGGTVEKFIGDAVMAVWGAPTAREDDAERAVRAALELVDAVRDARARASRRAPACSPARPRSPSARPTRAWSRATSSTPPPGSSRPPRPARSSSARRPSARRAAAIAFEPAGEQTLKGKARAGPGVARAARGRGARRPRPRGHARGAVRRPRRRAAAAQGPVPRHRRASGAPASCRVIGPAGHRQEPPRVGVREVPRRHRRDGLVAPRPLARLRRGHHLLGAGRDGPRPGGLAETDDEPTTRRRSPRRSPSDVARRAPSGAGSSRRCSRCSGVERGIGSGRSCSVPGGRSSSGSPRRDRSSSCSRTSTGPTRARSTSSTTCSSGARDAPALHRHARPAGAARRRPDWGAGRRNFTTPVPRAARPSRRCASCSPGSCPGLPEARRPGDRRPGRGHPAVCGRDRADARRGGPPRRRRRRHVHRRSATSRPSPSRRP